MEENRMGDGRVTRATAVLLAMSDCGAKTCRAKGTNQGKMGRGGESQD